MEETILKHIDNSNIEDTLTFSKLNNFEHTELVGVLKSLESELYV